MAKLHMTIDPTFTHRVVEILNEKLWDGDIDGINKFMADGFGITNHKLIAYILAGKYVMVFNEDGSGNIKPREDITAAEVKAMGGIVDELTIGNIHDLIKLRLTGSTGILERQKYLILNFRDLFDYYKMHTVDFDSNIIRTDINEIMDQLNTDIYISTTLSTKDIIQLYVAASKNDISNDVIENIKNVNGDASRLIYIMDETCKLVKEQKAINTAMDYIGQYIFNDIKHIDLYNQDGSKSTYDEQMSNMYKYFWMSDFHSRCDEIYQYYQYIFSEVEFQKLTASQALSNEDIVRTAVHDAAVFNQNNQDINKSNKKPNTEQNYNTGSSLLDAYLNRDAPDIVTGPVVPFEDRWDAGWISPDGAFWAAKGSKVDMLHMCLASSIQTFYANCYGMEYLKDAKNPDRELESHGWLKFHHDEVSYIGYKSWNIGKQIQVTNRQIDKLHDYAKHMGYKELYTTVTEERIKVAEMLNYTKEEWQHIFE